MPRQTISSGSPWEPIVGFSRAVRVGEHVHVAGTGPVEPDGGCAGDARQQARRCWAIIRAALVEAGAEVDEVVRTRTYVTDPAVFDAVNEVHHAMVGRVRPASTLVVAAGLADPRWLVEIEVDAVIGSAPDAPDAPPTPAEDA